MSSTQSPLMQQLTSQMSYLTQRQSVLSQNVANLDTPGYNAVDLKKPDFSKMAADEGARLAMRTTSGKHLTGTLPEGSGFASAKDKSDQFEVTPMGNNVSLEQQMAKINDTDETYQLSSNMYKKFTTMYRATLGK